MRAARAHPQYPVRPEHGAERHPRLRLETPGSADLLDYFERHGEVELDQLLVRLIYVTSHKTDPKPKQSDVSVSEKGVGEK